jgi:membrane-bound inhibitor of C-type lysozyme
MRRTSRKPSNALQRPVLTRSRKSGHPYWSAKTFLIAGGALVGLVLVYWIWASWRSPYRTTYLSDKPLPKVPPVVRTVRYRCQSAGEIRVEYRGVDESEITLHDGKGHSFGLDKTKDRVGFHYGIGPGIKFWSEGGKGYLVSTAKTADECEQLK